MPPIFHGEFSSMILGPLRADRFVIAVCLLSIVLAGAAGASNKGVSEAQSAHHQGIQQKRGLIVATLPGVMGACFAYGLAAGDPIKEITMQHGTSSIWQGLPVLVVVLAGGFTTNFIWCVILNLRNRTGYQYFESKLRGPVPGRESETIIETATDAPGEEIAAVLPSSSTPLTHAPMLSNYLFSALAGTTWYMQFFFYTMGETQMGRYKFSSWTLHMASIIIFSTLWGIALKEWNGTGRA
jgi:L-rhamnose-H+ transport protein